MKGKKYNEKERQCLEDLHEITTNHPFKHDDIENFYRLHQGGNESFILDGINHYFMHMHLAIYTLLTHLDQHGDILFHPEKTENKTTLREHVLCLTEETIESIKKADCSQDFRLAGVAALSCHLGLTLGPESCKEYGKNSGHESIALIEHMPAVISFPGFKDIIKIIACFHANTDYNTLTDRSTVTNKPNSILKLSKYLIDAELKQKRAEIFTYAGTSKSLWLGCEVKTREQAQAEYRKLGEKSSEGSEFNRSELKGLVNLKYYKALDKLKDKIIVGLKNADQEAVSLAEAEVEDLKKAHAS